MSKNIIIVVLAVLLFVSMVYGSMQSREANQRRELDQHQQELAKEARKTADANAMEALKQRETALAEVNESLSARIKAEQARKNCKGGK
jgi:Tfp pilus assembly protein PilO